jgi:CubicO group peptidase (beta-lactamase class C family)
MKRRDFIKVAGGMTALQSAPARLFAADLKSTAQSEIALSDTSAQLWMSGFPPHKDRIIRFSDGSYAQFPQIRWSLCHIEELVPTRSVWRGSESIRELPKAEQDLSRLPVQTLDGRSLTLHDALQECYTDGFLVMHRGKIILEQYFAHCKPHTRHLIQSATKSFVGTLVEELIVARELDREQLIPHYLPELSRTAWHDARVADVLDMLVGMKFDEDYSRQDSEVYRYLTAMGMLPSLPGADIPQSVYEYLPSIAKQGEHNCTFAYREPNISVLGWLLRRVTGMSLTDLISERIWQPLGMERDAYCMIDSWGAEGSLAMTLRDFARFGDMILNRGSVSGWQVLSTNTIESLFEGGDIQKFAAGMGNPSPLSSHSYRSQWWVRHLQGRNALQARGAYGQSLYIDPKAEVVIARFGSAKTSPSADVEHVVVPIHDAIITALTS